MGTPKLLLANTHQRSGCTPSTRGGQTPGPTMTGRSSTKVDGRSSEPRPWMPCGRRSTRNGPRGPPRSSPSGSESAQARRPDQQNLPKTRREVTKEQHLKRKTMRKKRKKKKKKRRRRRSKSDTSNDL